MMMIITVIDKKERKKKTKNYLKSYKITVGSAIDPAFPLTQ